MIEENGHTHYPLDEWLGDREGSGISVHQKTTESNGFITMSRKI